MSGLSGFWTVYLNKNAQKRRKIWTVLSGLSKKAAQKPRKIWAGFLDKPLKTVQILRGFWAVFFR